MRSTVPVGGGRSPLAFGNMTRILPVFLLAMVSCSRVAPVSDGASTTHDFSLSLVAVEPILSSGTVPRFRLTLTNISDRACRILNAEKRVDLQHAYYHLVVLKDGKPVDVPMAISDPGPVSDEDWLEVPLGGTKIFNLTDFPEHFETLPPGIYEAYVDFWRDPFQSHATAYLSPRARFTITK